LQLVYPRAGFLAKFFLSFWRHLQREFARLEIAGGGARDKSHDFKEKEKSRANQASAAV
jgi:hypothetical protein